MRLRTRTCWLLASVLATASGPSLGQVTARQGEAAPPDVSRFASPMILELPFPDVRPLKRNAHVKLPDVRKYVCDDHVTLLGLTAGKEQSGGKRPRWVAVVLSGRVLVADSYDRRVDVALRLESGGEVVASQTLRNLKAEEERATPFRVVMPVDAAALDAAYAAQARPVLEISLTVRDDS